MQLARVLASPQFRKARRGGPLLRYLVAAAARHHTVDEYTIGVEVFGRDPATYSPGEDPVVRVQMGRLRRRLAAYYAGNGRHDAIRFAIPPGTYAAQVRCMEAGGMRLAFMPASPAAQGAAATFVAGLNDELRHRLHVQLGALLATIALPAAQPGRAPPGDASHILESSVRSDGSAMRANLRLLDVAADRIVWSRQVDLGDDLSIARQEQLARLCCEAVRDHFGNAPPDHHKF